MVFPPSLGAKNGGVLSMRMQVIMDSSFVRPGLAPIRGGKKVEFRDWTNDSIGHYRNVKGLGKSMVVFRLFEKLRYSNERSTIF